MKCPNCCSPMLVFDRSDHPKSHVTFYRCTVCGGQHVSAEPVAEPLLADQQRQGEPAAALAIPVQMA